MIQVPVTIRSRSPDVPALQVTGVVPYAACPLAVTARMIWDATIQAWKPLGSYYVITHRPTGLALDGHDMIWDTLAEAMAVLERCEPTYPAWPLAAGRPDDAATVACGVKFRMATA